MKKINFVGLLAAAVVIASTFSACKKDKGSGTEETKTPSVTNVTPAIVVPGQTEVTITGTNLDLATAVAFGNDAASTKLVQKADFAAGATATQIKVTVPADAVLPCGVAVLVGVTPYAWEGGQLATSTDLAIINNGSAGREDGGVMPGWSVKFDGINLDKITSVKLDNEEQTKLTEDNWHADGYLTSNGWLVRDNNTALYVRVPADKPLGVNIELSINNGAITQTIYIQPDPEAGLTYKTLWNFNTTTAADNAAYSGENLGVIGIAKEWGGDGKLGTRENDPDDHFITWPSWTGAYWMVADNWMFPFPTGIFKAGYDMKVDVKLANDILIPSEDGEWTAIKLLFKMGGVEYTYNILSDLEDGDVWTTGGTWKTITVPLATSQWQNSDGDDVVLPGTVWTVTDRGIVFAANEGSTVDFTGLSIDNVIFDSNGSDAQPEEPSEPEIVPEEPAAPTGANTNETVADPDYVYFDFNEIENPDWGKGVYWGLAKENIKATEGLALSGGYAWISAVVAQGDWVEFFFRNGDGGIKITTAAITDAWSVKFDIYSDIAIPAFKLRLGDYWYTTPVIAAATGWQTITAPLADFKDNDGNGTNAPSTEYLSGMDGENIEVGAAVGYEGGTYNFLIDNVRFAQ
ncbi:hypothetical protein AGMMS4956_11770 [Bacteroidia bacterium]|nr:hypothetical protein AGMMS4956_11770 [Bacteroidia bacterium]